MTLFWVALLACWVWLAVRDFARRDEDGNRVEGKE